MESSPSDLHNWAYDSLQLVSRTFALSIEYQVSPIEEYMRVSYLLCRIPDTIEDEPNISADTKQKLLTEFKKTLHDEIPPIQFVRTVRGEVPTEVVEDDPEWRVVLETPNAFRLLHSFPEGIQEVVVEWVDEMTYGMNKFTSEYSDTGIRLETIDELEEYCYFVAGTVGHLLAEILAVEYDKSVPDELHKSAENFGLLLQLVNIAKDVNEDYETENAVFLPERLLNEQGVPQERVNESENKAEVGSVVSEITEQALDYTPDARKFLNWAEELNENTVVSFASPYLLAVATIRELQGAPERVVEGDVKIERAEVLQIMEMLESGAYDTMHSLERNILSGEYSSN